MKKGLKNDDVVSMLLLDESLTEKDLIGILAIFFFAGFDTTANSMTMILYNLARNPDVQRRAREDAFEALSGEEDEKSSNHVKSSSCSSDVDDPHPLKLTSPVTKEQESKTKERKAKITPRAKTRTTTKEKWKARTNSSKNVVQSLEQLFQMKYLTACVKETLRMFPVVPMISREVTQAHPSGVCPRFEEHKTFGIAINMFGLHYNPNGWAQPDQFLPERWLDPTIDGKKDPSQRVYCPFAIGKRSCLGRHFAYIEMLTVVSTILRKFEIVITQKHDPAILEAGTLLIDPKLRLGLKPLEKKKDDKEDIDDQETSLKETEYTLDEVSQHHEKDDLWMAINEGVYDLTRFAANSDGGHPGGLEILLTYAGTNATAEFEFISHSAYALRVLEKYRIGRLYGSHTPLFKERNWRTGRYRETVRLLSEDWATAGKSETVADTKGGTSENIRRRRRQRRRSHSLC